MSDDKKKPPRPEDSELEREIRSGRKFSLAEAIGRLGGRAMLKGVSPVTLRKQAVFEIEQYLEKNLHDSEGALEIVLLRRVRTSETLLKMGYDRPLDVLARYCERVLGSEELLHDFVRAVDAEWGRMYQERPHFQKEGQPPDKDDPYTFSSVRDTLSQLLEKLQAGSP
jgi:hypothetical protein